MLELVLLMGGSGTTAFVEVDEIDVNQDRPGQSRTGHACAGEVLTGRVASLAAQARSKQGGRGRGIPNFAVSLAILTHAREDAVVLPPPSNAVREGARVVCRPITLGIKTPEGGRNSHRPVAR